MAKRTLDGVQWDNFENEAAENVRAEPRIRQWIKERNFGAKFG